MPVPSAPALLCTDLDRTLLPNGPQAESPLARPLLRHWLQHSGTRLAFVSGRRLDLQLAAIQKYDLPLPHHIIADVGASLYDLGPTGWVPNAAWHQQLSLSWQGQTWRDILPLLTDLPGLQPQDEADQADHKLSFNVADPGLRSALLPTVSQRLQAAGLRCDLIWSVDETSDIGLLDVMAAGATKLGTVRCLASDAQLPPSAILCAGDSGNDLPLLTSEFPAVLVANATDAVRAETSDAAAATGHPSQLHVAQGGFLGMNGCYAAGILEGIAHFFPAARLWLEAAQLPTS